MSINITAHWRVVTGKKAVPIKSSEVYGYQLVTKTRWKLDHPRRHTPSADLSIYITRSVTDSKSRQSVSPTVKSTWLYDDNLGLFDAGLTGWPRWDCAQNRRSAVSWAAADDWRSPSLISGYCCTATHTHTHTHTQSHQQPNCRHDGPHVMGRSRPGQARSTVGTDDQS